MNYELREKRIRSIGQIGPIGRTLRLRSSLRRCYGRQAGQAGEGAGEMTND